SVQVVFDGTMSKRRIDASSSIWLAVDDRFIKGWPERRRPKPIGGRLREPVSNAITAVQRLPQIERNKDRPDLPFGIERAIELGVPKVRAAQQRENGTRGQIEGYRRPLQFTLQVLRCAREMGECAL